MFHTPSPAGRGGLCPPPLRRGWHEPYSVLRVREGHAPSAALNCAADLLIFSYSLPTCFFMWFSAFFSSLLTCACEMPISPATSICVRP